MNQVAKAPKCRYCGCRLFKSTTTWLLDLDMYERQNNKTDGTGFCKSRYDKEQLHDHDPFSKEDIVNKLLCAVDTATDL